MIEKSVYVAFDGKEFENAEACLAHEKELQAKDAGQWREIDMVFVFNGSDPIHRTNGSEENYVTLFKRSPQYLYFANDEDAEEFSEIVNKLDNLISFNFDEAGLWCYSYSHGWDSADNIREGRKALISNCNRQIDELNSIEDDCEDLIEWG